MCGYILFTVRGKASNQLACQPASLPVSWRVCVCSWQLHFSQHEKPGKTNKQTNEQTDKPNLTVSCKVSWQPSGCP
jgi:hypothetical protein